MKAICKIKLSKLRNDELFELLHRILNLGLSLLTQDSDVALLASYKKAVEEYDIALNQYRKFAETETVKVADKWVDETYRGLKLYLRSMKLFPDKEKRKLADEAIRIMHKYGNLTMLSYDQQYGALHAALDELQGLPSQLQTALGLTPWIEGLAQAIAQFVSERESLTAHKGAYQVGLVKKTRSAAEQAHRTFVATINAFVITFGEQNYATFINQVNAMIVDAKTQLKSRTTRSVKDNELPVSENE